MTIYTANVYWTVATTVQVEANSKAEADSMIRDATLPPNHEYMDGSFEVEFEDNVGADNVLDSNLDWNK
jgi:hypothetical protein